MQQNQRGTVAAGLLLAACFAGFFGYAAGVRAEEPQQGGVIRNGRFIQSGAQPLKDAGAQREVMIAALHSLEQKLDAMQRSLDAIERHERNTYVLLGNQKVESPKE